MLALYPVKFSVALLLIVIVPSRPTIGCLARAQRYVPAVDCQAARECVCPVQRDDVLFPFCAPPEPVMLFAIVIFPTVLSASVLFTTVLIVVAANDPFVTPFPSCSVPPFTATVPVSVFAAVTTSVPVPILAKVAVLSVELTMPLSSACWPQLSMVAVDGTEMLFVSVSFAPACSVYTPPVKVLFPDRITVPTPLFVRAIDVAPLFTIGV